MTKLKSAENFSVSADSIPDLAHVHKLTVIVQYLTSGKLVERFIAFLQTGFHKAKDLAASLLD